MFPSIFLKESNRTFLNSLGIQNTELFVGVGGGNYIKIVYKNSLKNKEHYKITPYNYTPKRSLKIVPNEFIDLG